MRILIKEEEAKNRKTKSRAGNGERRRSSAAGDAKTWVKKLAVAGGSSNGLKDAEARKMRSQAGQIVKHIATAENEVRQFHAQTKALHGNLEERLTRLENEQVSSRTVASFASLPLHND